MVVVARALGDSNAMSATLEIPMINCELFFIIQSPLIPFNRILPPLTAGRLEWRGKKRRDPLIHIAALPVHLSLFSPCSRRSRKHQIDLLEGSWRGSGADHLDDVHPHLFRLLSLQEPRPEKAIYW
jgi:hypothetical protein